MDNSFGNYVRLRFIHNTDIKFSRLEECTFCECLYRCHYYEQYDNYMVCFKTWQFLNQIPYKYLLIINVINTYLVTDLVHSILMCLVRSLDTWIPPCMEIK
jgi:hypothetical protein